MLRRGFSIQQQQSLSSFSRSFSEMVVKKDNKPKLKKSAVVNPVTGKTELVQKQETPPEELIHELRVKRDIKINNKEAGLVEAALDNVNKITFTKEYVIQQSGTPDIRGEVIGVNSAGVPMIRRTPHVARPTLFTTDSEITDTYFDLPDGFNRERFYVEIARENWSLASYMGLGLAAYWYYWPQLYGWIPTLGFITAVQAFLARYGGGSLAMQKTDRPNHPLVLPDQILEGKICVVTGGSSGVGLATVIGFAKRGADVLAGGRRDESMFWKSFDKEVKGDSSLTKEQKENIAKRVQYQSFDMAEFHSVRGFADFVQERLYLHAKALGRIPVAPVSALQREDAKNGKKKTKIDIRKEREEEQRQQDELRRLYPAPLDILVNNAGCVTNSPKYNSLNVELMLATNVLGPMFLTELLIPNIRAATKQVIDDWNPERAKKSTIKKQEASSSEKDKEGNAKSSNKDDKKAEQEQQIDPAFAGKAPSPFGRVVNVTSMAHVTVTTLGNVQKNLLQRTFDKNKFKSMERYALSKLLNIYYSDGLARRGVRSVCCTPGPVASAFFRESMPSIQPGHWAHYPALTLFRTPKEGANTVLVAALAKPENEMFVPGMMYTNCNKREHSKSAVACNERERAEFLDWAKAQLPIKGFDKNLEDE